MSTNLDKTLNLIIRLDDDQGKARAFIHSAPIARQVFEQYFLVIAQTWADMVSRGFLANAGPRVAALMLRDIAQQRNEWDGQAGVANGLMAEIRRLTSVVYPSDQGWQSVTLHHAITQVGAEGAPLTEDDVGEAESRIVFFIVASAMALSAQREAILSVSGRVWRFRVERLSCTDLIDSLRTSRAADVTGEKPAKPKAKASSIPR